MPANSPRVVLSGSSPQIEGLQWEASERLCIGRQPNLDIVIQEPSLARQHAEVAATGRGWMVRDLANNRSTFLNGIPLEQKPHKLQVDDVLHCGKLAFRVAVLEEGASPSPLPMPEKLNIKASGFLARVQSATQRSWEQGLQVLADNDPHLPHSKHFFTLVRAGHHLSRVGSLTELLQSILNDTVAVFDARHGAILLHDDAGAHFELRAFSPLPKRPGRGYSQTLVERCFSKGESLLCADMFEDEQQRPVSAVDGSMASIICALLRSPRQRLGVLHLDRGLNQEPFTREDLQLADALAASISVGVECALLVEKQREPFMAKTAAFVRRALELRDPHTGGHMQRVQTYASWLGEASGLSDEDRKNLQVGALLHDLGKISIPDAVLQKPDKLTAQEFALMKEQTLKGVALAEFLPDLAPVLPIIRSHHERWDGTGYPDGLSGESIPLLARIVAVADAFDAMTSEQPYRPGRLLPEAFAELTRGAGTQFDPKLVQTFLSLRPRLEAALRSDAESLTDLAPKCS